MFETGLFHDLGHQAKHVPINLSNNTLMLQSDQTNLTGLKQEQRKTQRPFKKWINKERKWSHMESFSDGKQQTFSDIPQRAPLSNTQGHEKQLIAEQRTWVKNTLATQIHRPNLNNVHPSHQLWFINRISQTKIATMKTIPEICLIIWWGRQCRHRKYFCFSS